MIYAFYSSAKILTFYKPTSGFLLFFQIIFISLINRIKDAQFVAKQWNFTSDIIVVRSQI